MRLLLKSPRLDIDERCLVFSATEAERGGFSTIGLHEGEFGDGYGALAVDILDGLLLCLHAAGVQRLPGLAKGAALDPTSLSVDQGEPAGFFVKKPVEVFD